jgi:ABC-type arginine/histidine transport system permease subunit
MLLFTPVMRGARVLIQLLHFYAGTIFINSEGNKEMYIVFRSVYILLTG